MPAEKNLEFKVGIFVLLALLAFTVFIFSITDSSVFEERESLRIVFEFANGLKKNAPVRIAGVDEGTVKNIGLFFDRQDSKTKAGVELWIKKGTKIPSDSVVTINQLGLLGEKYVEIIPGIDTKQFFEQGQTVIGKDPVSQEEILERIIEVARKLDQTIAGFNRMIADEQNLDSVSKTLKNLSMASGNLNDILEHMKSGEGTMGKLFYDNRFYDDLQGMTSDLKKNPWKLFYRPKNKE